MPARKRPAPEDTVTARQTLLDGLARVEHPEVVADRLIRYAEVVGRDNVMAGTDCGFGTAAGMDVVVPSVTWAKF